MSSREEIILKHAKSDEALQKMKIADAVAGSVSLARDTMVGSADSDHGVAGKVSDLVEATRDLAVSQPVRWVYAKPILERINEDLQANGYKELA